MKTITRDTLKDKIERGDDFHLVDVLSPSHYEEVHIKGARNIPLEELRQKAPELLPDKDKEVITCCASFTCPASGMAAKILQQMGYTNVIDYSGGIKDWTEAGYPVECGRVLVGAK